MPQLFVISSKTQVMAPSGLESWTAQAICLPARPFKSCLLQYYYVWSIVVLLPKLTTTSTQRVNKSPLLGKIMQDSFRTAIHTFFFSCDSQFYNGDRHYQVLYFIFKNSLKKSFFHGSRQFQHSGIPCKTVSDIFGQIFSPASTTITFTRAFKNSIATWCNILPAIQYCGVPLPVVVP